MQVCSRNSPATAWPSSSYLALLHRKKLYLLMTSATDGTNAYSCFLRCDLSTHVKLILALECLAIIGPVGNTRLPCYLPGNACLPMRTSLEQLVCPDHARTSKADWDGPPEVWLRRTRLRVASSESAASSCRSAPARSPPCPDGLP